MTARFQIATNRLKLGACVAAVAGLSGVLLNAQPVQADDAAPGTDNGRYALAQTPDGMLRLDTRLGTVSTCNNSSGSWVCRVVPDERSALDAEIGKLQAENASLKAQLVQRDATAPARAGTPPPTDDQQKRKSGAAKIELPMPADHAKLMALLDRVWQRLVAMADTVQKKLSEKI